MMVEKNTAAMVIDHGISLGADFAELFVERNYVSSINTTGSKVEPIRSGIDFGVGIRLIFDERVLYGYTNNVTIDNLKNIIDTLCVRDKRDVRAQAVGLKVLDFDEKHPATQILSMNTRGSTEQEKHLVAEKVEFLLKANQSADKVSEKISTTKGFCLQREQGIQIYNSEGLMVSDVRNYTRAGLTGIAQEGTLQATGSYNDGGLKGWELSKGMDAAFVGEEAARQALVNLEAKPCPSGEMPVVIGNGFGGVIFHEACGHLLETTSVAKKASVFHDQMGQLIANTKVNAVDDGLLENTWGSINVDDEGMLTQRTQLIKDGKLVNFLVDKVGSQLTGYPRSGSGRRESYRFAPASRMRNTFIEPGEEKLEDMIESIDRGIYAAKMGGGSVQPGTGEFNFAVTEGYYVEKGKIQYPVKAATLISTGPKVLKEISMVGQDFELACGMCGSVSGSVPTTVGQPAIKVDTILVGGNA